MRTAIITGASGGLGREYALELMEDHNVVIHYNQNQEAAKSIKSKVEKHGKGDPMIYGCDISNPSQVQDMIEKAANRFDSIDVLVNNAGIVDKRDFIDRTPESMDLTIEVNLMGTIYCTQAVLPHLIERGRGNIVNISSTAGTRGSRADEIYGASKGGVISFSKSIARHYTEDGIFTNVVAPATVNTSMLSSELREEKKKEYPLNRIIEPEQVAEAVRFFATTTSVSGKTLEVDGGRDF